MIRDIFVHYCLNLPQQTISDYFTHIRKNTWKQRFKRFKVLPRPYKASPVSKQFRKLFDNQWIRGFLGVNLGAFMMLTPFLRLNQPQVVYEPKISIPSDYLQVSAYEIPVTTQEREFVNPIENMKYVGQGYHEGHHAYDLNAVIGTPIRAFTSGRVSIIENGQFGLGKYIVLDHGHDLFSVYAHLKLFTVEVGEVVETGQQIGEIGMTGRTTGPHVHFEIREKGVAISPKNYLGF